MRVTNFFRKFVFCVPAVVAACIFLPACSGTEGRTDTEDYIVKSGDAVITAQQFVQELELKKAAYPYDIKKDRDHYNNMVIQLTQDLAEEVVLMREARTKGIEISEQEMAAAEKKFRAAYPDNVFEKMLLENAVDYPLWRERFRRKLLIDHLIHKELKQGIEITPGEVTAFYSRNREEIEKHNLNEKDLVARFRMEKAEKLYYDWINKLREKHPVTINDRQLKQFLVFADNEEKDSG